jgi:multiple sugar transport system permease protein
VKRHREFWKGLLFISPLLAGFTIFTIYPVAASLYYSFCDFDIISPARPVGAANYLELVRDERFVRSLWNTLIFTVFAVPVTMLTALAIALLLNMKLRGQAAYRTIFFLPSIVPVVASSVLWLWLLNPDYGLLNLGLRPVLDAVNAVAGTAFRPPGWLVDPRYTKAALVLMSAWGIGGSMILYLAALGDVPAALYEAAEIDGAGAWRKAWHITLPMISPVLFFTLIMGLIGTLQYFSQAWIMTPNGQPGDATLFYALYLFANAFLYLRMGYASAQAWILFVVIVAATVLVFRSTRRFVYYGGEGT